MGDAAQNLDPALADSPAPNLALVNPNATETSAEPETIDESLGYPDLPFFIEERKIVTTETSVIAVTTGSRLKTVLRELSSVADEELSVEDAATFKQYYTDRKIREQRLADSTNYLNRKVKVGEKSQTRAELVNLNQALDTAYVMLKKQNHPVGQIIAYIYNTYGQKIPSEQWETLYHDILVITSLERVEECVDAQIHK